HSHGYESRSAERSWLMSFKLTDSTEAARYFKGKGGDAKDDAISAETQMLLRFDSKSRRQ
ncbi:hypothetical protein IWQ56_000661, partial [Coemansia nantahalensis]